MAPARVAAALLLLAAAASGQAVSMDQQSADAQQALLMLQAQAAQQRALPDPLHVERQLRGEMTERQRQLELLQSQQQRAQDRLQQLQAQRLRGSSYQQLGYGGMQGGLQGMQASNQVQDQLYHQEVLRQLMAAEREKDKSWGMPQILIPALLCICVCYVVFRLRRD
eukprot:TRINITY_DN2851_c2_g1_i1.p2 TRINITY_DN2851_c2_g1~~TRINITY_DN2851_c2_g1_i1.p2  ORF type:complete len:188 (+),score=85.27 TRINITY_DN2851_c2_g1_i1:66-566(+)